MDKKTYISKIIEAADTQEAKFDAYCRLVVKLCFTARPCNPSGSCT